MGHPRRHTPNCGVLITPFHNMALICPDARRTVDRHTAVFDAALRELFAG